MPKLAVLGVCLLFGVLAGLTLLPDDGTPGNITFTEAGSLTPGASQVTPLPPESGTNTLMRELLVLAGVALVALVLVPTCVTRTRRDTHGRAHRSTRMSRAVTRRGPPAWC